LYKDSPQYVILGTAGHIDHGKSALVKALTGIDPDRLPEEKERGITIDLGFAHLAYPDGLKVGIVDVPGHERLIKNMLAGAGGIDMVLMVIAADEGIMPQGREHLAICNLLRVKRGLIVITKIDLVERDWLNLLMEDVRSFAKDTFLEDAPIISVSAKTGENIEPLKEKIREIAWAVEPKPVRGLFRLPIDRVFTLKGFGTVVTGTAISGSISLEDTVEILPKGIKSKVRGLQSHGQPLKTAYAGQRVAVNLQGVTKEEIERGNVLTIPGGMKATSVMDAEVEILRSGDLKTIKNRSLLHLHTGTSEVIARIILNEKAELKPGEKAYCQFRLQEAIAVMAGDRYILRGFSPLQTIGGGEVLDPSPRRRKKGEGIEDLKTLRYGSLEEKLLTKTLQCGLSGIIPSDLHGWIKAELPEIDTAVESLIKKAEIIRLDGRLLHKKVFDGFSEGILSTIGDFHKKNPLKPGVLKEDLRSLFGGVDQRLFDRLLASLKDIVIEREIVRLKTFNISLSDEERLLRDKIIKVLEDSAFQPPMKEELSGMLSINEGRLNELLKIMVSEGSLIRINDSLYLPSSSYAKMIEALKEFFNTRQEMTVAEFRDILNTTRKYALPFLEYLDTNKITIRIRDIRKLTIKHPF